MRLPTILAAITLAAPAFAEDRPSWFVYCDGFNNGAYTAYITQNIWPSDGANGADQQAKVRRETERHLERERGMTVSGCETISFGAEELARQSQERTAELHRRFGHAVHIFSLPDSAFRF